mgnify:CR=1 FL=1
MWYEMWYDTCRRVNTRKMRSMPSVSPNFLSQEDTLMETDFI